MRYFSAIVLLNLICLAGMQANAQQPVIPMAQPDTIPGNIVRTDTSGLMNPNPGATDTLPVTSLNSDLLNIFNQPYPKKYKIANITVTGNENNNFDENLLLSIAGLNVGDEVSLPGGDNFSKAITKLWGQNYFSDVAIYLTSLKGDAISVEIHVTERPRLSKYVFNGVKKGEKDDLTPKTGLVVNRVITENVKRTSVDAIKKFYADKGFRNVSVSVEEVSDSSAPNASMLVYNVVRGSKVKIAEINFLDNTVSAGKLKAQMKGTKEKSHLTLFPSKDITRYDDSSTKYNFHDYVKDWGFLSFSKTREVLEPYIKIKPFSSAKFDAKKYDEDKSKVIAYYNSLGYRDATIVKDDTANATDGLHLYLSVDEGHKYYFGNVGFSNATKYSDSVLIAILGIKKGDTYNRELLEKKLGINGSPEGGDISGLYQDDGYLFFQVNPVETAVYNDTIDYDIRVTEGPQATFKNIKISGNDRTKEYIIRRELRTLPGEKFSRTDVIRSQRELANLGFFNQEKIVPNIVPDQENGTVDVDWQVEEKSGDQLELSAGFGGGIGVTGTLGVTFNNFSIKNILHKSAWDPLPVGDGQKLSVRVQSNGRAYRSYNASFTEPWLGGKKRNAFSVSVYDTKFANAYDASTGTYTKQAADTSFFRTTGFSVGLTKQLKWPDDYFSAGVALEYARYQLKNYYIDATNLPNFNNGFSNNVSLKFTLQRYSEDQQIFPRTGSNFQVSLQVTPPYSLIDKSIENSSNPYKLIEYYKWRFSGEWYVPIGRPTGPDNNKQFVLKLAAKYGYIGRYNPEMSVSPFERFQVGDAGLSNSYALLGYDIISQRGYPVYETSDPRVNPDQQGASQYFTMFNKYTLELRYPFALNPSSTIFALGFFEAANGWYSFKDYNPFRLRRSTGLGVRFFLPMFGLLGFDYGVGLDRLSSGTKLKDASRFTFMLGYEPD
ncbi:outer membrane protein assembly factor [Parafilimonas sp.]|uniref:BamA/OMP85 family outer membrane protein n=1 Tax=Parafilimonas sp. TaxID=1969739 RepID=UPI0039E22212